MTYSTILITLYKLGIRIVGVKIPLEGSSKTISINGMGVWIYQRKGDVRIRDVHLEIRKYNHREGENSIKV